MLTPGDKLTMGIYSSEEGVPTPIEWIVWKTNGNLAQIITQEVSSFMHPYASKKDYEIVD